MPIALSPAATGLTCGDLLNVTRERYLLAGQVEQRNKLAFTYTSDQTVLTFRYDLKGIQVGSVISAGLNTFYVWEINSTAKTAVVEPGYAGSKNVQVDADTPVRVAPRHTDHAIFTALNEELAALSSPGTGLYAMRQTEFTYNASRIGYDLPGVTDLISIHSVRYAENDQYQRTPQMPSLGYRLERNYLTSENSSSYSLKLYQGAQPGRLVTVLYKAPFTVFDSLATPVSAAGLSAGMADIPPMGAALRLGVGREVRRNQFESQGDTRRAEEVPAGSVANSYRGLAGKYQMRVMEEAARLASLYPVRS